MITAPTAVGRTFVNRAGPILVEEHRGPSITVMPGEDPHPEARIVTLTDRDTGAVVQLDEHMLDFVVDQLITPAVRMARRVQARYDVTEPKGRRVEVKTETAHVSGDRFTVEADVVVEDASVDKGRGVRLMGVASCALDVAGDLDFNSLHLATLGGRIAA
jgi:hypothetical protein